jgi:sigma-B regulation protein RsbU (phosphoserine phosphatase)
MISINSKNKILVIDDHQANVLLMTKILEKYNFEVFSSVSCSNVMELIANHLPDIILLDIMMPDTDGIEMLRILKNSALTKAIPVVIVSAKTDTQIVEMVMEIGAVDFVKKPISIEYLLNVLNKLLKRL